MWWRPLSVYLLLLAIAFIAQGGDLAKECDLLARDASRGFQCHKKPLIMWQACLASCVKYAEDLHPNCAKWANEGRCEKNMRFMQIQCAPSCGMAIAWNPMTRQSLGMVELSDEVDTLLEQAFCPADVQTAADILRQRLRRLVEGDGNTLHALQATFHSPLHSLVGLAESCLYATRLYDLVLQQTLPGSSAPARELAHRLEATIQVALRSLDVDLLTRSLRRWIAQLETLHTLISLSPSPAASSLGSLSPMDLPLHLHSLCNRTTDPSLSHCQSDWEADAYDTYHANLAAADASGDLTSPIPTLPTHQSLPNGVRMPVLGLYLHSMDMAEAEAVALHALRLGCQLFLVPLDSPDMLAALSSALTLSHVSRTDIFLAAHFSEASLHPPDTPPTVSALVEHSLQPSGWAKAGLDLLLLDGPCRDRDTSLRLWSDMQTLYRTGRVRSLGVSNMDLHAVHALCHELHDAQTAPSARTWVRPMVVAGKYDVYHAHKQLDEDGVDAAATLQAWLPGVRLLGLGVLSGYPFALRPLADPIVRAVACDHTHRVAEALLGGDGGTATANHTVSRPGHDEDDEGDDWGDGYDDGDDGRAGGAGSFAAAAAVAWEGDGDDWEDAVRQTAGLGIPWDQDGAASPAPAPAGTADSLHASLDGTSPAQVLLRQALEQGGAAVFQTRDLGHLEQNLQTLYMAPLTPRQKRVLEVLPRLAASAVTRAHPL